jgi:hypothetical protein
VFSSDRRVTLSLTLQRRTAKKLEVVIEVGLEDDMGGFTTKEEAPVERGTTGGSN